MPLSGKVLEDSIRLSKIRRIKLALYVVQTVALVALAFVVAFVVGDAAMTPRLHLPIASFIAVIVLLLLIICVESFFFRVLEIRFARSSSARHLMAKNSMKRSLIIALITGLITVVLTVPAILGSVEDATDESMIIGAGAASDPPSFWSMDPLELTSVDKVRVTAPATVEIYIVTAENYDSYKTNMASLFNVRLNRPSSQYVVTNDISINVPQGDYVKYYIILNDINHTGVSVTIFIEMATSDTFTGVVSLFMIAFVVSNVAWFAYLVPIERKYSAGSIYK
jgi:hypothetical protein